MGTVESEALRKGIRGDRKALPLPPGPPQAASVSAFPQGILSIPKQNVLSFTPSYPTRGTYGHVACIFLLSPVKCSLEIFTYQLRQIHKFRWCCLSAFYR